MAQAEDFVIPSNPADQKKIKDAIQEAADSLLRISAEKELIKDIAKVLKDDLGMPPRLFNKMAKVYFNANFGEVVAAEESFQEAYTELLVRRTSNNMHIIDFSALVVATVASDPDANAGQVRHMVLDRILSLNKKFKAEFGRPIIAIDHPSECWRKKVFPYYKAKRKEAKASAPFSWDFVEAMKVLLEEEFRSNLPYKVISVPKAEADDVVGALVRIAQEPVESEGMFSDQLEPVMIVSRDKDFGALQVFKNVKQFDPVGWKEIRIPDPKLHLADLTLRGDGSDGIPNLLSDDCFVIKKRQTPITQKVVDKFIPLIKGGKNAMPEEYVENYVRNKLLIDLVDHVPPFVHESVRIQYNAPVVSGRLMGYLVENRLKQIQENINLF